MRHEEEYEEDWKAEAPLLASLGKPPEAEAPEGYFDALPTSVMARIRALETTVETPQEATLVEDAAPIASPVGGKVIGFRRWAMWSAAAGVALLIGVGVFLATRPTTVVPDGLAETAIEKEVMEQLANLETAEVATGLDAATVSDEELFAMLGDEAQAAFDDEDHAVQRDEAYEYLQDLDLDAVDLQGLEINIEDLD